jgi:hypothetical protein
MSLNPLLRWNSDPDEPAPILELKTRLLLYIVDPPDPNTARDVYNLYMARFGSRIAAYRSTALGSEPEDWSPTARARFENVELPELGVRENWGYMFGSGELAGARLFMFHGSRPVTEVGRASLLRFDFEWDFDPIILRQFAIDLLSMVECVCGTAGYVLVPDEGDYAAPAYELMFAWAMRYWGAEAQDLDAIVEKALTGFPCVSWLTVVGPDLQARNPDAINRARAVAYSSFDAGGHAIIQTEERPRLIDRNRREPLGNYPAVADVLAPLQVIPPISFSGDMWDEDSTSRYLRRFTHPGDV